jgi:putative hemolysin
MEIAILAGLILLNGLFAMSEIALVSARKGRLQRLADDGDEAAQLAIDLGNEPTRFLSTIQIGITAIGILNGIVGEAALAAPLSMLFQDAGLASEASGPLATMLIVVIITYFTILAGELVPKRIAQINAEAIARLVARPIATLAVLSRPFVYALTVSTDTILRTLVGKHADRATLTEEDIHAVIREGSEAGVIEQQEHAMLRNVFRLDERQIASLMTPRSEIVYLDLDKPLAPSLQILIESDHSRFPVCRGSLNNIIGVTSTKRLLKHQLQSNSSDITSQIKPAVFVPESLTALKLLEQFRHSGVQMVFVVDEYGEVQGLITLQDFLEALTGEFHSSDPKDVWALQRADGSWLLDGMIPIPELQDRLGIRTESLDEKRGYNTLGGMLMWLSGKVPQTGDALDWQRWRFEVVDMDGNRIDKVLASRLP